MNDLDLSSERMLTASEVADLIEIHPRVFEVYVVEPENERWILLVCNS